MVYEFIDDTKHLHLTNRPAEAMSFDGQYLEDIIPGYDTINVRGRETLYLNLQTSGNLPARDGEILEEVTVLPREIIVTYALSAATNETFRTAYDTMKHHLMKNREQVPIMFLDEPGYTYYGVVSDVAEVEPGVNTVVGEIKLFCSDPYKYAAASFCSGPGSVTYNPEGLTQPLRPIIKVTLAAASTKVTVTNTTTGKKIILNGSYDSGDVLLVDATAGIVTKNGGNIKGDLDYVLSDYFHFLVSPGNQLIVTPSTATIELNYRRRLL